MGYANSFSTKLCERWFSNLYLDKFLNKMSKNWNFGRF